MSQVGRKTLLHGNKLTILHLSDLHFGAEADETDQSSAHDHQKAASLSEAVRAIPADIVIVSGDLTHEGKRDQLLRVKEYLFGTYSVSGNKRIGLSLEPERVRLLPGNHDAFDLKAGPGRFVDRVQRSLDNFNNIFSDVACTPNSCSYEWIVAKDWNGYLAYADSCFVGDPHWEQTKPKGVPYAETTAKGKLAHSQAQKLLKWSDRGRSGELMAGTNGDRSSIPSEQFLSSLKILVMHHYLFEPKNVGRDPLMSFVEDHRVFRNIALADFDMLWCGHKHVSDFTAHTYGRHMGDEGRWQYSFNCLRRSAGMPSLPLKQLPVSGKTPNRFLRFFFAMIARSDSPQPRLPNSRSFESELAILQLAIDEPRQFEKQIKLIIDEMRSTQSTFMHTDDVMELGKCFEEEYEYEERKLISSRLKEVGRKLVASFHNRPFIQALAPSATKRVRRNDSVRGFFVHEVTLDDSGYKVAVNPHEWNDDRGNFGPTEHQSYTIPLSRHP